MTFRMIERDHKKSKAGADYEFCVILHEETGKTAFTFPDKVGVHHHVGDTIDEAEMPYDNKGDTLLKWEDKPERLAAWEERKKALGKDPAEAPVPPPEFYEEAAVTAIVKPAPMAAPATKSITQALMVGDLSKLSPQMKEEYYLNTCRSVGLNPFTKPFEYIKLNGKEILYAGKNCAEQLRKIHNISITLTREDLPGLYAVRATAAAKDGRTDESLGAVPTEGLKGEALANALMKAETKAKRRVTLSICGLGMLDETEVDTIPGAAK